MTPSLCRKRAALVASLLAVLPPLVGVAAAQASLETDPMPSSRERPVSFAFDFSVAAGVDHAVARTGTTRLDMPAAPTRLSAEAAYARRTRARTLRLFGGATFGYQPHLRTASALARAAGVEYSAVLGRRTRVELDQRLSDTPLDFLTNGWSGGERPLLTQLASDAGITSGRMRTFSGYYALSRTLGRRSSGGLRLLVSQSSALRGSNRSDVRETMISGRFEYRLGPFASLRTGYGIGTGQFSNGPGAETLQRHDVDVGIDYERPLSFLKRTRLLLSSGSTVLVSGGTSRLRLATIATLERQVADAWAAKVQYGRPVQYVAGFRDPLLADAVAIELRGRMGRRLTGELTSAFSRGAVGLESGAGSFTSRSYTARLRWRAGRLVWFDMEAHNTAYRFIADELPLFVPEEFVRRGIRGGMTWSTPLQRR